MSLLNEHTVTHALKELGVYVTQNRIAVMKVLMHCTGAISVTTIRRLADIKLDRVSVYRTLQAFFTKGVLLVIPNSTGIPHYMLKPPDGSPPSPDGVFFICSACGNSERLPDAVEIKHPPLHKHTINNRYLVMEGICLNCKKRN
jgi:Fur family transcriptional regulator, ferric uptake regulator